MIASFITFQWGRKSVCLCWVFWFSAADQVSAMCFANHLGCDLYRQNINNSDVREQTLTTFGVIFVFHPRNPPINIQISANKFACTETWVQGTATPLSPTVFKARAFDKLRRNIVRRSTSTTCCCFTIAQGSRLSSQVS